MKKIWAISLLLLPLFFGCKDKSVTNEDYIASVSLDEIYQKKIITYVDSSITLETKMYWEHGYNLFEPSDSIFAGDLTLKFENGDNYISNPKFKHQFRGDMMTASQEITKKWVGKIENYYFKGDTLSNNNKLYLLRGRIRFRNHLTLTEEKLRDSVFINQCNDVTYWFQTFEFQIENIIK